MSAWGWFGENGRCLGTQEMSGGRMRERPLEKIGGTQASHCTEAHTRLGGWAELIRSVIHWMQWSELQSWAAPWNLKSDNIRNTSSHPSSVTIFPVRSDYDYEADPRMHIWGHHGRDSGPSQDTHSNTYTHKFVFTYFWELTDSYRGTHMHTHTQVCIQTYSLFLEKF